MKSILVPTDYSPCANNAMEYALELAKATGASITLLHVYHVPVPAGEVPLMLISPAEIIDSSAGRLKELKDAIRLSTEGKINVTSVHRPGFAADEISIAAGEINADLIVMGIKGSTSSAAVFMGSVTTSVIRNAKVPVLSVPENARFSLIKNIAFAFDYAAAPGKRTTEELRKYADLFSATIQVVNIVDPAEKLTLRAATAGVMMEEALEATPHQLFFTEGTNVAEALHRFTLKHYTDWLVMTPHNYSFFSGLFHKSATRRAAFHTEIPLLTIHD